MYPLMHFLLFYSRKKLLKLSWVKCASHFVTFLFESNNFTWALCSCVVYWKCTCMISCIDSLYIYACKWKVCLVCFICKHHLDNIAQLITDYLFVDVYCCRIIIVNRTHMFRDFWSHPCLPIFFSDYIVNVFID